LARAIDQSSQRLEAFKLLQTEEPAVTLPKDVSTRWNSTFLLLVCALRLKDVIARWIATYGRDDNTIRVLHLSEQDWVHISYLIVLLRPYFIWTEGFSKSTSVTINLAWLAYNDVFRHLEDYNALLRGTGVPWKVQLANCLGAAQGKLSAYYSRTDGHRGLLYNLACVLDLTQKLTLYNSNGFNEQNAREYDAQFWAY
jgi:hypothetical protein